MFSALSIKGVLKGGYLAAEELRCSKINNSDHFSSLVLSLLISWEEFRNK